MSLQHLRTVIPALCCALLVSVSSTVFAETGAIPKATTDGEAKAIESVENDVQAKTEDKAAQRREKITKDAVDALAKTKEALKALEEERTDDALKSLAVATGKLELAVSREPSLALAPTDVMITTRDLFATSEAIEQAIADAKKALDKGKVQKARRILEGLGSEMVITTTNVPLATYPDAIKAITPLIDDDKIEEAKRQLQAALNTLVLTESVIPLPVLRAEALLTYAEELAETTNRTEEKNRELSDSLSAAQRQLEMAELLGYGKRDDYKTLYEQLAQIEEKTDNGKSGKGFFDTVKKSITSLWS